MPISNLLIVYPLTPPSLVDDLRSSGIFQRVDWVPQLSGTDYDSEPPRGPTEEEYERAEVILCFGLPSNLKSFDQTPYLKLLQVVGSGTTQITGSEWYKSVPKEHELVLANAAGIAVGQIGEHVLMTTLMLLHKMPLLTHISAVEQRWAHPARDLGGLFVRELRGMTVGILGYGHIGRESARLFTALGCRIWACTRSGQPSSIGGYHHAPGTGDHEGRLPEQWFSTGERAQVAEFLRGVDVLVDMLPSSEENKGFIGREELGLMKDTAILINVGRGDTIDQEALVEALRNSLEDGEGSAGSKRVGDSEVEMKEEGRLRIWGAALDVTTPEPLPPSHPLFSLRNCIITPHCSWASVDNFRRACEVLVENVKRLNAGKGALNALRGKGEFDD